MTRKHGFSDRLSMATLCTNQLRLSFSSLAYVLVHALGALLTGLALEKALRRG